MTTDQEGEFTVSKLPSEVADVASGLPAVRFDTIAGVQTEVLSGTGAEIAAIAQANGGSIVIDATQRVKPEPVCYVQPSGSGTGLLRFPFTNRFGTTLTVQSDKLNSITSLADPSRPADHEPYPLADFESTDTDKENGHLGFEWSLAFFEWFDPARNSTVVSAQWKLINETVSVDQPLSEIPICTSPIQLDRCSSYTTRISNRLYAQMFSSVAELSRQADRAAKRGKWRNRRGQFRNPFFGRAALSLRTTRQLLNGLGSTAYICPSGTPQGCSVVRFPKAEVLEQFDSILRVALPKELRFLYRVLGAERVKFLSALREQPNSIVVCQR